MALRKRQAIVDQGIDYNAKNNLGNAPLHEAVQYGFLNVVKDLVERGADINITNDNGRTPLYLASGNLEMIKYLIENGADFRNAHQGDTPLHQATWENHLDIVEYLVERGADIEARHETGGTPLMGAVIRGYLDITKYLIEKGANINVKGYLGNTPLHEACKNGHLDIVEYLVEQGADFNILNNSGDTPLHEASGRLNIIRYLIGKGADFNKASRGSNPLHQATWNNHLDIVKYLVEIGADIEARHESGNTPLQGPAIRGYLDIVRYLVENRANINVHGYFGYTPLHEAAKNGHLDVVQYLVGKGADIEAKDNRNRTPLEVANEYKQPVVANFLSDEQRRRSARRNKRHLVKYLNDEFHSTSQPLSFLEAQTHALDIIKELKKALDQQAESEDGIKVHRLNIDFMKMEKQITGNIMSGEFEKIWEILKSDIEKACPERETGCPGKLSLKKFDKFLTEFDNTLHFLQNKAMQQILTNNDVYDKEEQRIELKPKYFINGDSNYLLLGGGLQSKALLS